MTTSSIWVGTHFWPHNSSRVCGRTFNRTCRCEKSLKRQQSPRSPRCWLPANRVLVSLRRGRRHYEESRASLRMIWKRCSEEKGRKRLVENRKERRKNTMTVKVQIELRQLRRRRSLISAQGWSAATTLGMNQAREKTERVRQLGNPFSGLIQKLGNMIPGFS